MAGLDVSPRLSLFDELVVARGVALKRGEIMFVSFLVELAPFERSRPIGVRDHDWEKPKIVPMGCKKRQEIEMEGSTREYCSQAT